MNWFEKVVREPFRFKPDPRFQPCLCYYSDEDFDPKCPEHGLSDTPTQTATDTMRQQQTSAQQTPAVARENEEGVRL